MVVVCLAPADLRPEIDDLTGAVRADWRRADLPAAEAAALEHGLRIAEAWGGWVLAVAAGPPTVDPVLREAMALGADALRVEWDFEADLSAGPSPVPAARLAGDPEAVAAALAGAITRSGNPSVVICGDRSAGQGVGAVPALLAHELGIDQALGLVFLAPEGPGRLVAERRLDAGWRERLVVTGPAVVSVEGAGTRLRRADLASALDVATRPVRTVAAASVARPEMRLGSPRPYRPRTRALPAPVGGPHERLLALTGALSTREPARVVGPLEASAAADELLAYLDRYGYRT